jgi:predicted nucleotidyltransferase
MTDNDRQIISKFKGRVSGTALARVRKIILFGSRVREDASEDSDLDLLVLVDEMGTGLEEELEDAAYAVMWEHDFRPIISLKVFTEARYKSALERGYSFYKNVEREGVAA